MRYEDTPRPNIEHHHHIRYLIESQERRAEDRQHHRDRIKLVDERESLIRDSKPYTLTDFYCRKCKEDFKAHAIKEIEIDWSCDTQRIAFYKTKCFKGHWCIRFITDRNKDPFWMESKAVVQDRGKYFKEIVQPFEEGYNMLYGKK